jgi:hypothetical protein
LSLAAEQSGIIGVGESVAIVISISTRVRLWYGQSPTASLSHIPPGKRRASDRSFLTAPRLPARSSWFESELATKKSRRPNGSGFAGLRERTFPAPFDVPVTHRFL